MKIRFQADNDLDQRIVVATRRLDPGIEFQTASKLGLHGIDDSRVLQLAAQQGRVLVSHDRRTLPAHFERFINRQQSPGLIIISQRLPIGLAAEMLHLLWAASDAEEYVNAVYDLGGSK
jgi:predicted nuclease of predicted toxin-antitoxin system